MHLKGKTLGTAGDIMESINKEDVLTVSHENISQQRRFIVCDFCYIEEHESPLEKYYKMYCQRDGSYIMNDDVLYEDL